MDDSLSCTRHIYKVLFEPQIRWECLLRCARCVAKIGAKCRWRTSFFADLLSCGAVATLRLKVACQDLTLAMRSLLRIPIWLSLHFPKLLLLLLIEKDSSSPFCHSRKLSKLTLTSPQVSCMVSPSSAALWAWNLKQRTRRPKLLQHLVRFCQRSAAVEITDVELFILHDRVFENFVRLVNQEFRNWERKLGKFNATACCIIKLHPLKRLKFEFSFCLNFQFSRTSCVES